MSVSGTASNAKQSAAQNLLEPQERAGCQQIAVGDPPHSQRAQALLALDQGASQAEAARSSGLSAGQVRYWLGRFRQRRMEIFPADALEPGPTAAAASPAEAATPSEPAKKADKAPKKKSKKEDKKSKKKSKAGKKSKKKKKKGKKEASKQAGNKKSKKKNKKKKSKK